MNARSLLLAASLAIAGTALAAEPVINIYKHEGCGCCVLWANHLEKAGYKTTSHEVKDVSLIRRAAGVPESVRSCHTAFIGPYAIEGHVPAADIKRLLKEKPANARGLAVAGMPAGSPGMEGAGKQPYEVLLVMLDGSTRTFARH